MHDGASILVAGQLHDLKHAHALTGSTGGEAVWLSISGPKTLLEELQRGAKTELTAQTAPMKGAMGAMGAILQAFSGRQDKRPVSRGEASCPGVVPHAAHALNQNRIARLGSSRRTCPLPSGADAPAPLRERRLQTLPAPAVAMRA